MGDSLTSPLPFRRCYAIIPTPTERNPAMDKLIKKTPEFKALRVQAREIIAAFADGADFDFTINRLAEIGEKMSILLA